MTKIDLQTAKIELAQIILDSQDENFINKVKELIDAQQNDFLSELTAQQKEEIKISRSQIKNNLTEDWETLKARLQ